MRGRVCYLLRFYLLTVLIFIAAKVAFMLFNYEGHEFGVSDICQVIWNGLSLDLSTALYILALPFLMTIVSVWVKVPRWLFYIYDAIIALAFALAFTADTSLYPFWGFKLDASCLQYLDTPTEAMASVSRSYSLKLGATLLYLLFIPLMVIGIRGGLDESTTNVGQVYFSQNQFLNHSAVNPVFSFLSSMEKTASYVPDYHFMDDAECERVVAELYPTESIVIDTLLTTQRPNVVVILMESCGAIFTGLEGRADVLRCHLYRVGGPCRRDAPAGAADAGGGQLRQLLC